MIRHFPTPDRTENFRRRAPSGIGWLAGCCVCVLVVAVWDARGVMSDETLERQAAAVLARHCLECHNSSEQKGGLDLARRESALRGGDSGPVIQPNEPDGSALVQRVESGEMPPRGRLPLAAAEKRHLRDWVAAGAQWANDPIDPFQFSTERRAGRDWWSLQPIAPVEPPVARPATPESTWPLNPIDQFILERLERAGLKPSPAADRRTLIRRLSFDLVGLPPSPEEVEQFVNDPDKRAYEKLVDRLLDSPHYGERWARHWLDIVRFSESQGFERNKFRPSGWKYRDFVVEAFQADLPYDDFVRWQLAGDVLHPEDPLAVIASGFLTIGPYDLTAYTNGTPDMRAFAREEELEGLVGTVCQTFLGLTVNCARCHDHKFDPVSQREYYQISASLGGTYHGDERECVPASARPQLDQRIGRLRDEIRSITEQEARAGGAAKQELSVQRSRIENLVRLLEGGPVHTTVPQQPGAWRILARGDYRQPGEVVAPAGLSAVVPPAVARPEHTSRSASPNSSASPTPVSSLTWNLPADAPEAERRKRLAEWIVHPDHPLTARVMVNRLWGFHFGDGLVRTASDFGFQGGMPSHPELLDWLAGQLRQPSQGKPWSLKHVQRLIVTSATYRQASGAAPEAVRVDADNRLVWRWARRRLDAESFRDAVLAVAGQLDPRIGGPSFQDFKVTSAGNNETYSVFDAVGPEFNRRTLYRACVRAGTSPLLDALDCPDPSVATPRRSVTSTPLQALALLNNRFMEYYAARFAERVQRDVPENHDSQIRRAYQLAFSREATPAEEAFARRYIGEHGWNEFCLVVFNANEFLFID